MHYNIAAMGWLPQWVGCCNGLVAALGWLLQWVGCCNGLVAAMGWLLQWVGCYNGWLLQWVGLVAAMGCIIMYSIIILSVYDCTCLLIKKLNK